MCWRFSIWKQNVYFLIAIIIFGFTILHLYQIISNAKMYKKQQQITLKNSHAYNISRRSYSNGPNRRTTVHTEYTPPHLWNF